MQAQNFSLQKIFSPDFVLNVPIYQRPYSWHEGNAEELYLDLFGFMDDFPSPSYKNQYFLGSIVLVKKEEPEAEILDGQQRLTTLTILLSALRRNIEEEKLKGDLTKFLYEEGNAVIGTETRYRLTLRDKDTLFFQTYIQDPEGFDKFKSLKMKNLSDSQKNLVKNAQYFNSELSKLTPDQLKSFANFILTRCYLVVVWTPDLESAFRIFSVLNTRGLPLSPTDILKADCIAALEGGEQKKFSAKWESLEEDLGIELFSELFAHIRMIARRTKAKETLVKEIKVHVEPQKRPMKFLNETLEPSAMILLSISDNELPEAFGSPESNRLVTWLNMIDNRDWLPPVMRFLKGSRSREEVTQFLSQVERLASGMMLMRLYENDRVSRYGRLLELIEGGTNVYGKESPLMLTEREVDEIKVKVGSDVYLFNPRVRRYVLLRLDEAMADGSAKYDFGNMTVEHVLPQNPDSKSRWVKDFNDEQREVWTHKLANLVPLSKKKNSGAGNLDFVDKKEKYFGKRKANFILTQEIMGAAEWTPAVLKERQARLVSKLCDVWSLK